ncbi:hypothetical protein CHLNCDRAFT_142287 [Chlorella variabilis]|uniref:FHA domain-containing protein n=1 Tax=Chlorella variabilis TaxID=554065 RepID=E1Z879_CHLVA|nr:hypothetical protein CHLNCDRAFT_142287 [Chlorella variabilis]EFN58297.1 hypothetical protein CHLNCDRAFT_142287 [Chlorella variabilis]|eukprot:XP_005850399.1 hypothetical protein CHLNCDRAFT_142287 [Chlorella variabilis]
MGSSLWLLEAKRHATEDRSSQACSVKFWLKPGAVVVGRQGQAELPVGEDKSISRKHADITVPTAEDWQREEGGQPYVLLKDRSKYGTWVSPTSTFADSERLGGEAARVPPNCMVRFGYKSPFKLYHQASRDWVLYLSPAQREAADAGALAALEEAAAATGLPLTDQLPDHPGTRVLALGAAPLRVDGPTLLALLRGYPVVGASWQAAQPPACPRLLEWQQQQVWRNSRPEEGAYPVQLQYEKPGGRVTALAGPAALLRCAGQRALAGRSLLWLPAARDAALQEAARLLGAANSEAPASGRGAAAAAKAAGAVVVRGSEADAMPASYRKLAWTTPQLLIAGMLEGSVDAAVQLPAGEADTTPPAAGKGKGKGRGGREAAGTRSTTGSKGRGRGRKGAALEEEEGGEGQGSGSETDASEDLSHLRGTQRVLAAEDAAKPKPSAAAAAARAAHTQKQLQQQQQQEEEEAAQPMVAAAPQAAAGGRKRRKAEQQEQEQQQDSEGEEVHATPAKKRRQGEPGAAAAAGPPAARAARAPPRPMPEAEGWHTMSHGRQQRQQQQHDAAVSDGGDASPQACAPADPTQPAASAAKTAAAGGAGRGRRGRTNVAAAAGAAPAAAAEGAAQGADGGADGGQEGDGDAASEAGRSVVAFLPLIAAHPPPAARGTGSTNGGGGGGGPNYKAFRKSGGAGAAAAVSRTLVAFAEEPYAEDGPVDAGAFIKAEAERRRRLQQADELFAANVKARKAAPLPGADGDTPPKPQTQGRGRGRGSKKATAAAAAGQQSMLNFLPAAGAGRGRGRGRKGKA